MITDRAKSLNLFVVYSRKRGIHSRPRGVGGKMIGTPSRWRRRNTFSFLGLLATCGDFDYTEGSRPFTQCLVRAISSSLRVLWSPRVFEESPPQFLKLFTHLPPEKNCFLPNFTPSPPFPLLKKINYIIYLDLNFIEKIITSFFELNGNISTKLKIMNRFQPIKNQKTLEMTNDSSLFIFSSLNSY